MSATNVPQSERVLAGRAGAYKSWAQTVDPTARTANGRRAADERFERQVDPDGLLSPTERARRAEAARREHYAEMARKSVAARRKRKTP